MKFDDEMSVNRDEEAREARETSLKGGLAINRIDVRYV